MFGGFVKLLRHCGGFTRLACIDGFEPHLVHGVGDFVESFGQSPAYTSSVMLAVAWPSCFCRVLTSAPQAMAMEA